MPGFAAPASIDPTVRTLGAEAATESGRVRFAEWPSLRVAAHEATHVLQGRRAGRPTDGAGAERHADELADGVRRGWSAADLAGPALVSAPAAGPQLAGPPVAGPPTCTVMAGDTLWEVSRRVYGSGRYAEAIRLANPGKVTVNAAGTPIIHTGDVLNLPEHPDAADPWVTPELAPQLRAAGAWTEAQAVAALLAYGAMSAARRQEMVAHYLPFNQLPAMLAALPALSTQAGGRHEQLARDLLQRIQRIGAQADAATRGLGSEGAMARAQATEMIARNRAAALAARPASAPPPSTADVAAQQAAQVAAASIAPQTATLSAAQESTLNTTLIRVSIPVFVAWVAARHPGLGLTAAHLRADARAIFERGIGIIAFADGSNLRAVVGETFRDMVAANPAYTLPTVVHEVWGHDTFEGRGNYGNAGAAYGLDSYDQAAALMPGYTRGAAGSAARQSEIDNYGYQETEMYSLMREVPFFTPNAPADAALDSVNYDPGPAIRGRMRMIVDGYEPRVVRDLYRRFMADPTVGGRAMGAFRSAVRSLFRARDAAAILA